MAAARGSADRDQTCDASPWTRSSPQRPMPLLQGKNRRSGRLTGPGGRSGPRATIKPMHASRGRKEDGSHHCQLAAHVTRSPLPPPQACWRAWRTPKSGHPTIHLTDYLRRASPARTRSPAATMPTLRHPVSSSTFASKSPSWR